MASTYTTNNGIEKIGDGEQSGTWGDTTNTNFDLIDESLDGQITVTLAATGSSGAPNTITITDGASSNGRNRYVNFNDGGDLGGTAYVQLGPNDAEKVMIVRNSLSGSRSILLFQGTYNASNDYELVAGATAIVGFDGGGAGAVCTELGKFVDQSSVAITGGTLTGVTITLGGDLTVNGNGIAFAGATVTDVTGADTKLVSGTAGTSGDLSIWNADGDLVDGPTPPSGTIVGTSDSQTLTNKILVLLDAAGAAPTTDGEIKFDRTGENLEVGDGSGTKIFSHDSGTATLVNKTLASPVMTGTATGAALDFTGAGEFDGTLTAKGDIESQAEVRSTIETLTSSTSISVNMATQSVKYVELDHDATFTISNDAAGQWVTLIIKQGSTGGTGAYSGIDVWMSGGAAPTLSTTTGEYDIISLFVIAGPTVLASHVGP